MKRYFVKTPWWIKKIYPSFIWSIKTDEKILYLTFDDGPHPVATIFVLEELKKYDALATFFCIGKNVVAYPEIFKRIKEEGHAVGNHTYNHLNGWKTKNEIYLADIEAAAKNIDTNLFRPPYGRIKFSQVKRISSAKEGKNIRLIAWDVLSADFDRKISPEKCFENIQLSAKPGSIIVFHDSEKALSRMQYALSEVLKIFSEKGYRFLPISIN